MGKERKIGNPMTIFDIRNRLREKSQESDSHEDINPEISLKAKTVGMKTSIVKGKIVVEPKNMTLGDLENFMGDKITIASLFQNFKDETRIEESKSSAVIARIEEGFHAGIGMYLECSRDKLSEMNEDIAVLTMIEMENEVSKFFEKKSENDKVDGDRVFDEAMFEIANEKFEYFIGAIDPSGKDGDIGTYSLVKKTKNGFEVLLGISHTDPEKFKTEVEFLKNLFDATIIKSR